MKQMHQNIHRKYKITRYFPSCLNILCDRSWFRRIGTINYSTLRLSWLGIPWRNDLPGGPGSAILWRNWTWNGATTYQILSLFILQCCLPSWPSWLKMTSCMDINAPLWKESLRLKFKTIHLNDVLKLKRTLYICCCLNI